MTTKHNHYYRDVSHLQNIDVYRVIELFDVTCPVMQHIIKKALCPGGRGHKDLRRDVQDIIDSATRKLGMMDEDVQTIDEGWIEWDGSSPYGPLGQGNPTMVEIKFRRGAIGVRAPHNLRTWRRIGLSSDIIAYRIVK